MQNYKIKWTPKALKLFNSYIDWYERVASLEVASKFSICIKECEQNILNNPYMARQIDEIEELREYVVQKYPFLISYYINNDKIVITSLLHQKQNKE